MPKADGWGQGIIVYTLPDKPDLEKLATDLSDGLTPRSNMRFSSAASRAATLTAPVEGMESVLTDTHQKYVYLSGAWRRVSTDREPDTTTTGASASSGWSLQEWSARRSGGWCQVRLAFSRTGAIVEPSSAGNIEDQTLGTIPSGWRPVESIIEAVACDGYGDGGAQIQSGGAVILRTWTSSGSLRPERTVRICSTYLLP